MGSESRMFGPTVEGHRAGRRFVAGFSSFLLTLGLLVVVAPAAASAAAACTGNEIVCENQLPGTPQSVWDVDGAGDPSIQGFATQMSVNRGNTIQFKIQTPLRRTRSISTGWAITRATVLARSPP